MKIQFLYILSFSLSLLANDRVEWCNKVFNNPDKYISDNYEKHIFKKLVSKFPDIKALRVKAAQKKYLVESLIYSDKLYSLVLNLDDNKKISKISRSPIKFDVENKSVRETIILQWLFKFFYFLDAGDEEAMYDMIFHEETKIKYGYLSNKKKIIKKLINDFPAIIRPDSITIREELSDYYIRVSVLLMENIYLEITDKLSNLTDTHILQKNLFKKIENSLSSLENNVKKIASKDELLVQIKQNYPDVKITKNKITIPYPDQGIKIIDSINYKLLGENSQSAIYSELQLKYYKNENTLILNDAYPISLYKSSLIEGNFVDKTQSLIENLYNMFVQFNLNQFTNSIGRLSGKIKYHGYNNQHLNLSSSQEWFYFCNILQQEGSIYFYPSKIDYLKNEIIIKGLLYVIKDKNMNFYHFGELIAGFPQNNTLNDIELEFHFYPFLSRIGVENIYKNN